MDVLDTMMEDANAAELGRNLKDAVEVDPADQTLIKAGFRLNESLDLFERITGPRVTIEKLLARIHTIQTRKPAR